MASPSLFDFKVTGVQECVRNLGNFGSPKVLAKIVGQSLKAGATIPLARARINARGLGLGFIGFVPRKVEGPSKGRSRRYGRIPPSLKAGRAYMPRGFAPGVLYRINVVARGQRVKGIYRNKAPHAQLIEYGFTHKASGKHIAGRPFMAPAMESTANQTVTVIAHRMQGLVDGLKFPTTGRGP